MARKGELHMAKRGKDAETETATAMAMAMAKRGKSSEMEMEVQTDRTATATDGACGEDHGGKGRWTHAAFHVATTIATPAAYAPLPSALALLGWTTGCVMLVVGTLVTWYNSLLLASLWSWDGSYHPTYRHLALSIFGKPGYYAVIFFQQLASIGNNITIQIAAATSMKEIYKVYNEDNKMNLQEFIIIFGLFELGLSQLPTIHSLRWVNLICTLSTIGFTTTSIGLSIYTGLKLDRASIDYDLHGTAPSKAFGILFALGTIAFSFGDAMLPEIQSTLKEPRKPNMYKGISGAYLIIIFTYWTLACVGYWAFGSSVSPYLLSSFTEPKWAVVLSNGFAIVQIAGCYQIYCRPTYAKIESRCIDEKQDAFSIQNVISRLIITTIYIVLITLTACALPFFGDFVALCGAIGFTPLDFILPSLAYLAVRRPKWVFTWVLNISIIFIYSCVAIMGSIGAVRFISIDVGSYKLFSNV